MKTPTFLQNTFDGVQKKGRQALESLRDVRNLGAAVFVLLILLVSWSGAKAIQTNYQLQQDVARLQQQNEVKKLQNDNQKLQNQYYTTSQYREVTARQNFGLAIPGETVLVVPKDVALAHTVPMPDSTRARTVTAKKPAWQENFQAWVDFLLHRVEE